MNIWFKSLVRYIINFLQSLVDTVVKEPDRPSSTYPKPDIVKVKGAIVKKRGTYRTKNGMARGLVVHYTVSNRSESSARAVLKYLCTRGLGCMVMDEDGIIYVPENFDLMKDVAYHAGKSTWQGKSGMSLYCLGMEICCWGRLTPESKKFAKTMRRSGRKQNIAPGDYEPYTKEQEESLVSFILWYAQQNPDFDIDWVVGHDEISPGRKTDPGASLSKTMPELREYLKSRLGSR